MFKSDTNAAKAAIAIYSTIFFMFFFFLINPGVQPKEYYDLTGENISYDYDTGIIRAEGNVQIDRGEILVKADSIEFNVYSGDILAQGSPVKLITPDEHIEGDSLRYNLFEGEGELAGARSNIEDINVKGDTIRTVVDKEHSIEVEKATLTPCNLPQPHYRLEVERILFYPGDRLVGKDATFFWGETSLFTLPRYVVNFERDEETEEIKTATPPSLLYEFGYDRKDGVFVELEYPYERENLINGSFYYRDTTAAGRKISAENELFLGDNMQSDLYYRYLDEETRLEEYGLEFFHEPNDYFSSDFGYVFREDEGEITENYYIGWSHLISPKLEFEQRLDFTSSWLEGEKEDMEQENPLTTTLSYATGNRRKRVDFHYNFLEQNWRREYSYEQEFPQNLEMSFYHDYLENNLKRRHYILAQNIGDHNYSLKFRDGYETNFLPYAEVFLDLPYNVKTDIKFGRLAEEDREVGQIALNPSWSGSWSYNSDLTLTADISYHHIFYSPLSQSDNFKALAADLGFVYEFDINERASMQISLDRRESITFGEAYLEQDKIDESLSYELNSNFDIITDYPHTGVEVNLQSEYNVIEASWDQLIIGIERYFDCYRYQLEYDFQRDSLRGGMSFDF